MAWPRIGGRRLVAALAAAVTVAASTIGLAAAQDGGAPPTRAEALAALDRAQADIDVARAYIEAQDDQTPPPTTTTPPPPSTSTPAPTTPVPPPAGEPVTHQAEAGGAWTFTGTWFPGATDTHTRQPGATATLAFTGTVVALYGTTAAHHGIATVSVDGGPPADIDQYAPTRTDGALLWVSPRLPDGEHRLVVTMTSRANPARVNFGDPAFSLDRAAVGGAPTTTPPTTTAPSTAPPPPGAQPVVTRDGRTLEIAGRQWKFAGLNADTWFGCWDGESARTTDAALNRYFGELHDRSLTRVWAYRSDPGSVATLRRVVAAAEEHDQYLMVTLSDGNSGGTQCGSLKGAGYPADGGPVLAHARALVPQFATSPAIAFWEIINEGTTNASAAPWYATIGHELGRLDPNTLVVGGAGTCWNGTPIANCRAVNDPAWNDMVNMHEYDWSGGAVSHHAQNTEALAASLGLPWFSGESGLCCGGGPAGLTEQRAAEILAQEWTSYLNAPGSAGMIYWDQKWAYNSPSTINLGDPAWDVARTFRHAWQQ